MYHFTVHIGCGLNGKIKLHYREKLFGTTTAGTDQPADPSYFNFPVVACLGIK